MSTILIQTRIDEYTTPELYAEMMSIPPGNARTTRLKNLANEALILKRQLGMGAVTQVVDSHDFSGIDRFTSQVAGKTTKRREVKHSTADITPAQTPAAPPSVDPVQAKEIQPSPVQQATAKEVTSGARAASRVLSMSTLRGG